MRTVALRAAVIPVFAKNLEGEGRLNADPDRARVKKELLKKLFITVNKKNLVTYFLLIESPS